MSQPHANEADVPWKLPLLEAGAAVGLSCEVVVTAPFPSLARLSRT